MWNTMQGSIEEWARILGMGEEFEEARGGDRS